MASVPDARARSYVREASIVVVAIKNAPIQVRNKNIFPSVIVVVPHCHAKAPAAVIQSRLCSHISKGSVMIVVVKLSRVALARANVLQGGSICEINVHPAVIVVVKD